MRYAAMHSTMEWSGVHYAAVHSTIECSVVRYATVHSIIEAIYEERAMAGARALSGWLRSGRAMVRKVRGATFRKLMEALVETVMGDEGFAAGSDGSCG